MSDRIEETTPAVLNGSESFDFVSSEDLRKSLESDYAELTSAITAKMWKAACVLAGSIAEALLMDYIAVLGNSVAEVDGLATRNVDLRRLIDAAIGIDALENTQPPESGWEFAQLADAGFAARQSGMVNNFRMVYEMSLAVVDFRNLIHPGRALRLGEHVDESSAVAARAFVLRLLSELKEESVKRYPYTAEHIMDKAQKDAGAHTILETMLRKARPAEITRLLDSVAPNAFWEECRRPDETLERISAYPYDYDSEESQGYEDMCAAAELSRKADAQVYRIAFDWGTAIQKRAGLHAIAHLLTGATSPTAVKIEAELLQIADFEYASDEDKMLIIGDVLDRICGADANEALLDSVIGIGSWIMPDRAAELTKALLNKMFLPKVEAGIRRSALTLLENEYENMPKPTQEVVHRATDTYRDVTVAFTRTSKEDAQTINDLVACWDSPPGLDDLSVDL